MKTNDPLDDLLQTWKPTSHVPAEFRERVWHRIASGAGDADGAFLRPARARIAAIAAAAVVVASFGLGFLSGNPSDASEARQAYFVRIDPLALAQ